MISSSSKYQEHSHFTIGLYVFIQAILVALLGAFAHHSKGSPTGSPSPIAPRKHISRYIHWTLGLATVGLWYHQIFTGKQLYDKYVRKIPKGIVISEQGNFLAYFVHAHLIRWALAFWVLFALELTVYLGGWSLEYDRLKNPKKRALQQLKSSSQYEMTEELIQDGRDPGMSCDKL